MADNITTTTAADGDVTSIPTGTVIRTDDVGGVQYQVVKLDIGGDGASSPVTDLATSAKQDTANTALAAIEAAVEGTLTVGSHAVTNAGTFAVQESGAALTALQLIDDTVYTDGTGTPSKAIGIAGTDGTNPQIIKTDSSGELQVDVLTSALPSGASTSAKQDTIVTTLTDLGADADAADIVYLAKLDDIIAATEATQAAVQIIDNAISGSEMQVDIVSSALPSGASTAAKQPALGTAGTASADVLTVQGIASMTALKVDGSAVTQPVSASSLPLPSGASTSAKQDTAQTALDAIKTAVEVLDNTVSGSEMQVDVVAALPAGDNNIGNVDVVTLPSIPAGTNNIGDVDIASTPKVTSATLANVASSATNVTLFAANAAAKGRMVHNDSTAVLYVKFGATATSSSYTVKMAADSYYEFPEPVYTGIVDGIWASANGAARCTET
jgi:hypothetical protein